MSDRVIGVGSLVGAQSCAPSAIPVAVKRGKQERPLGGVAQRSLMMQPGKAGFGHIPRSVKGVKNVAVGRGFKISEEVLSPRI